VTERALFAGRPFPLILSAPSGAGKTTIAHRLRERRSDIAFSISATTRPPRRNERDGEDYHFLSDGDFRTMIERGELLEWAEVHGNMYGTPRANVEEAVQAGRFLVLDIDVQGARFIRRKLANAVAVFIVPPSGDVLVDRLLGRGSERDDARRTRLANAQRELDAVREFDYVVVNDDLDRAVSTIETILLAESRRVSRVGTLHEDIARLRDEVGDAVAAE